MRISDWSSDVCSSDLGQVARALLCRAAAERWNTDWRELQTRSGFVVNGAERIAFGALAQDAARFNLPPEIPALHPSAPRLVGRSMPRLDTPAKLDGSARFGRSEEHTSELQSLMRISYAVFCLKKKKKKTNQA